MEEAKVVGMSLFRDEVLPCDFVVGHARIKKGVSVKTAQEMVNRMYDELKKYRDADPEIQKSRIEWERVLNSLHEYGCKCDGCEAYKEHTGEF